MRRDKCYNKIEFKYAHLIILIFQISFDSKQCCILQTQNAHIFDHEIVFETIANIFF